MQSYNDHSGVCIIVNDRNVYKQKLTASDSQTQPLEKIIILGRRTKALGVHQSLSHVESYPKAATRGHLLDDVLEISKCTFIQALMARLD